MAPLGTVLWKNMTCLALSLCAFHSGTLELEGSPVAKKLAQYSFIVAAMVSCASEYLKKPGTPRLSLRAFLPCT